MRDPIGFQEWLDELGLMSPRIVGPFGYHHNVLNPIQWGPVYGLPDPEDAIYGHFTSGSSPAIAVSRGIAPPEVIQKRWAALEAWIAEFDGVSRPAPYMDFYTTVYGNREDRIGGLWELWDNWDEYAAPSGPLDLGERPPPPEEWLLQLWDPEYNHYPEYPELAGLSFPGYSPKNQIQSTPYFRYRYSILSRGWSMWFEQVMRSLARVGYSATFVDNVNVRNCWNQECEEGFRAWAAERLGEDTATRVLTRTTSLLANHGFEWDWVILEDDTWHDLRFQRSGEGRISPDYDSFYGLYSARLEGPVAMRLYRITPLTEFGDDFQITVHYRMQWREGESAPTVTMTRKHRGATRETTVLPPSAEWTSVAYEFREPQQYRCDSGAECSCPGDDACVPIARDSNEIIFESDGAADVLIDEIWLTPLEETEDRELTPMHPTYSQGLIHLDGNDWMFEHRFRMWASNRYWDELVDQKLPYLREMARRVNPEFELLANSYRPRRGADMFMIEHQAYGFEASRQDTGYTPGLYLAATPEHPDRELRGRPVVEDLTVTNEFDYKASHALRFPDFFSYVLHLHPVTPLPYRRASASVPSGALSRSRTPHARRSGCSSRLRRTRRAAGGERKRRSIR